MTTIPFELFDHRINVNAMVNGEPGWLILDTGTGRTGLDRAWALRAGVELRWAPDSNSALVDSMRIAGLVLRDYVVSLFSTSRISERQGRFVTGLLGDDFLAHFAVEIDFPERMVRLYDRASYRYDGPGLVLPFASKKEDLVLNAYLQAPDGKWIPARLLLDTGNGSLCVILMTPFVERQQLGRIRPVIDGPLITGLVGPLQIAVGNLPSLSLGGV
ncbi:MAG TPA: retropepsin-like aspartic protease, partial [Gemmatimonadales bacterium]|nr:retropepsin-like aspartic protease [Gemmatimonadales bacterium]